MQNLTIGLFQFDQAWENPSKNKQELTNALSQSPRADLLLLPEMFSTGFSMHATSAAESWNISPTLSWLKALSDEHQCAIFTSLMIEEEGKYYNRGIFIDQGQLIATYDKQYLFAFAGEDQVYNAGNQSVVVPFKGWKICLQICFDLRFPESARNRAIPDFDYDLLLYVANWPAKRIAHWDALLLARAIENQAYMAAVNRVGIDNNGHYYNGHSCVVNPDGTYLTPPIEQKEGLFITQLSSTALQETRNSLPFLRERKWK